MAIIGYRGAHRYLLNIRKIFEVVNFDCEEQLSLLNSCVFLSDLCIGLCGVAFLEGLVSLSILSPSNLIARMSNWTRSRREKLIFWLLGT